MKELFYYTTFAIILYFILNAIFDNINKEKENFSPSTTIPNSSIVTLATIAQNLLNGNGTFTNPGNLQIGTSTTAPGNLTVTGNTVTSGIVSASGNINTGAIATGQLQIGSWAGRPAIWANTSNNPITLHNEGNTKSVQVGASSAYPNNLIVTGSTTSGSGMFGQRVEVSGVGNGYAFYDRSDADNRFEWYSNGGQASLYYNSATNKAGASPAENKISITNTGNLSTVGSVRVGTDLTVTGNLNVNPANTAGKGNITTTGGISSASISSNFITQPGIGGNFSIKPGTASPDAAIFAFGDGSGWRTRFGKPGSPTLDIFDNPTGGVQVNGATTINGMLSAPGNIDITNDNPHITFRKKGGSRIPQIYSDGSILHVYNGTFQSDENANINGFLDVRGGANIQGATTFNGTTTFSGGLNCNKGNLILSVDGFTGYNGASLSRALFPYGAQITGNNFCIGNTCIDETHLQMLTGARSMNLVTNQSDSTTAGNTVGNRFLGAKNYSGSDVYTVWTNTAGTTTRVFLNKN